MLVHLRKRVSVRFPLKVKNQGCFLSDRLGQQPRVWASFQTVPARWACLSWEAQQDLPAVALDQQRCRNVATVLRLPSACFQTLSLKRFASKNSYKRVLKQSRAWKDRFLRTEGSDRPHRVHLSMASVQALWSPVTEEPPCQ